MTPEIKKILSTLKKKYGKDPFLKIGDKIYVDQDFIVYVTERHLQAEIILNKKIEELKHGNNN